jgi:RNA polymerase sigma-70 factor
MPDDFDRPNHPADAHDEAFLQVLAHRSMLKAYLLAIVHDPHLAEDALSDTTLAIVRSWEKFDRRLPFAPWARGIARRVALSNLRKAQRPVVELDEDVMELLGAEFDAFGDENASEESRRRLNHCIEQLPERSRELVRLRYFDATPYEEIARRTGRSVAALYMAFTRIHDTLAKCVKAAASI